MRLRRIGIHVCVLLATTVFVAAQSGLHLPDPRTGVIDGRTAVLVWPARYSTADKYEFLSREGCTAHFVLATKPDAEELRPCGQWTRLQSGTYKVWLENNDAVSPFPWVLRYADEPFTGQGVMGLLPVVPAGIVKFGTDINAERPLSVRVLSLNTQFFGKRQRLFDRRSAAIDAELRVPAGQALAGLFDRTTGDALALSPPFMVKAGSTAIANPKPPRANADVLAVLERPLAERSKSVALSLGTEMKSRSPDVFVEGSDAVIAVWYDVKGTSATLSVQSDELQLKPTDLTLRRGRVTTYRGKLIPLPKLRVSLTAPENMFSKMNIAVRRSDDGSWSRRVDAVPNSTQMIENVPTAPLEVTLTADDWTFVENRDFTDGIDHDVDFTLRPITVVGDLYLGENLARGRIKFGAGLRTVVSTHSDDSGHYEAIFWQPGLFTATIALDGDPAQPYIDFAEVTDGRQLDFRIPDNHVSVVVVDAGSGHGVPSATVMLRNEWQDADRGDMTIGHRYSTGENGVVVLPRLRSGGASIAATATGYETSEPQRIEINASTRHELRIALRQMTGTRRIQIFQPDGRPAASAEAAVLAAGEMQNILSTSSADAEGRLELTGLERASLVIIRHASGAAFVEEPSKIAETVRLAPAATDPLILRAKDVASAPVRSALVTVWFGAHRLTDVALSYATWNAVAMTGADGTWVGRNLPATATRILATRRVSPAQIRTGAYDTLATMSPYPWNGTAVSIKVTQ